ncbi:flavin reductase family protein [Actinomadura sp. LOL_016]|uniref:flavin reductase family protein n=1 Tax=unclassified Actinomadura TaxID=2626254 RepID=UPI003A813CDF
MEPHEKTVRGQGARVEPASGTLDSRGFRSIMGSFPSGITVVSTLDDGLPRGATVTAFASISLTPPIVMVSLDRKSRTLASIRRHGAFAVHVLDAASSDVSARFATRGSDFDGVEWTRSRLARGVPVLERHCAAHAECLVHDLHEVGDHELAFGLVVAGGVTGSAPLVYHRSRYHEWPTGEAAQQRVAG